jgi:AcrR family transcriptional regulator
MVGRSHKVTAATWLETARRALVEEGAAGVKVDRLARRLGVTRGGFYHNFRDREDLLDQLLILWDSTCKFLPPEPPGTSFSEAGAWIEHTVDRLIEEDGYDHHFDMAVREWARSDQRASWAVERADRQRIATLEAAFKLLGYRNEEAPMRAQVFYFHQIGYYAIGVRQTIAERRRNAPLYADILSGADVMERVRAGRAAVKGSKQKIKA